MVGIRIEQLNSDNTLKTTPKTGDSVTLICGGIGMNSDGDSTLTYKWESAGNTLSSNRFHIISSVTKSDVKIYKCTVSIPGLWTSQELALTVDGKREACSFKIGNEVSSIQLKHHS